MGKPTTVSEVIKSVNRDGIWHRKSTMVIIRIGKRQIIEGTELSNQKKKKKNQNTRRKVNLLVLGNVGIEHHQKSGDEKKNEKGVYQKNGKTTWNQTIYKKNLIKGMNTWVLTLVWYSGPFLKWMGKKVNKWTWQQENYCRCIRPDILKITYRFYLSRIEGRR